MPMDGYTLSYLEKELRGILLGGRVERVNQPERDTLLLTIRNQGNNHRLLLSANANQARVQLTAQAYENPAEPPMFCMLMRKHLQGARLAELMQVDGDRVLRIAFDGVGELGDAVRKTLVLEMMGRYSNLTLVDENGVIQDCIRHVNSEMSRVRVLLPGLPFPPPPPQDKLHPATLTPSTLAERLHAQGGPADKALIACVSGMAGVCARELCTRMGLEPGETLAQIDVDRFAEGLCAFFANPDGHFMPVTLRDETGLCTDFFPHLYRSFDESLQAPYPTLSAAMDAFYLGRDLHLRMQQRSASLQKHIKTNIARLEKKRALMLETLQESEKAEQYRVFGELLTANLHAIPKSAAFADVLDYYDPAQRTVRIPLIASLTPAKNAQSYYKKYRKAKGAEQYAREQLIVINRELELLESTLDDLDKCVTSADLAEIRVLLSENGFLRPESTGRKAKKPVEGQPYRFSAPDGTEILIGKNALQNDRLTLRARGEETWLHAQGVPGSHVILRTEQEPTPETLLLGAKLAAYFSKGRNHPGLPVDFTRRKYVKKAAGAPAGFVTYTHFQTVRVGLTPEELVSIGRDAART